MVNPSPNIILKNLIVGYSKGSNRFALPELNYACADRGETIALIGPNGSGKSTLLRTLAFLQKQISGEIILTEGAGGKLSSRWLAKAVGFVGTEQIRIPGMTVREMIALGRYPHTNWMGKENDADKIVIDKALRLTSLEELSHRYIDELSDGERQKAMVARLLAQDPSVFILDEPTAYLDLANRFEIVDLLISIARSEGKSIIFSTHDVHHTLPRVDKIWLIGRDGVYEGSPEDIMLDGKLAESFPTIADIESLYSGHSGSYRKEMNISITGAGDSVKWTINGFKRRGIRIITDSGLPHTTINILKQESLFTWNVMSHNYNNSFSSIYELLKSELFR